LLGERVRWATVALVFGGVALAGLD
jgi:hypothetical protein